MRTVGILATLVGIRIFWIQFGVVGMSLDLTVVGAIFIFIGLFLVFHAPSDEKRVDAIETLEKIGKVLETLRKEKSEKDILEKTPSGTVISSDKDTVTYISDRRGKKEIVTRSKPRYMK